MAIPGYLSITGQEQGKIQGSAVFTEHEGEIEIYSFDHEIEVPSNQDSPVSSGEPVHAPIVINKEIDKSTPKLYQALCRREALTDVSFHWYRYTENGQYNLFYSITLENALIVKIRPWMPNFFNLETEKNYRFMEDISISYEKIIWSYGPDGDVEFEDSSENNA
jgi:type VI secretion system secreted protein Hcp